MQATRSSDTLVSNKPTWHHIPEDGILHSHRCENLKSCKNRNVSLESLFPSRQWCVTVNLYVNINSILIVQQWASVFAPMLKWCNQYVTWKGLIFTWIIVLHDRLCGLVVRVLNYRSRGPGSIPGHYKKSSGSGTGSTQPREYNWGATW
jgi:hypothetical protein